MGARVFKTYAEGKNAKEAFLDAMEEARREHGHRPYTGSIAEKDGFRMVEVPKEVLAGNYVALDNYIEGLLDNEQHWVNDKFSPAGCINLGNNKYIFFGWASS